MRPRHHGSLILLALAGVLVVGLVGCTTTAEVRSASDAVEAARKAGKDRECPSDFQAAADLVKQAESLCQQCKPEQANALALQAMNKVKALCPARPAAAAPAPAPSPEPVRTPAPAAPTASLSVGNSSIDEGACTSLSWSTANASSVSVDPGVGAVDANGSRQVCPTATTRYTLTATGAGGSRTDSATVSVTPKKPTDKLTIHVNFDTNKSDIRKADLAELQKAEAFVKKYSACKVEVDGYTDSTGTDKINQPLSERRAEAVKQWILDHGATAADHVSTKGFGSSNPVGDNKTAKGRFANRRAEILVFCQ